MTSWRNSRAYKVLQSCILKNNFLSAYFYHPQESTSIKGTRCTRWMYWALWCTDGREMTFIAMEVNLIHVSYTVKVPCCLNYCLNYSEVLPFMLIRVCFIYLVDDGTGVISCLCWKEEKLQNHGDSGKSMAFISTLISFIIHHIPGFFFSLNQSCNCYFSCWRSCWRWI